MLSPDFTLTTTATVDANGHASWFIFKDSALLVRVDGDQHFLPSSSPILTASHHEYLCVGNYKNIPCLTVDVTRATDLTPPDGLAFMPLRECHGHLDHALMRIACRALQLLEWKKSSLFCGRCGTANDFPPEEHVAKCPACEALAYPRLSPAMMVLIRRERQILLARSPHFRPGVYSALAGFVEPGETVEETIHREIFEEVGVKVSSVMYFGSQSWPFPHSLMLAFVADYESGDIVVDGIEIEDAQWFDIDALPLLPFPASISHRLITDVVAAMRADAALDS